MTTSVIGGEITLGWSVSSDASVTSYNIYYGTSSGNYTNKISVGNVTHTTIDNLNPDILYYFVTTSVAIGGVESQFSNETSGYPYELKVTGIKNINGYMNISFNSLANHFYTIEASTNLTTWVSIYNTEIQTDKSTINFIDTNSINYPQRFYRIKVD